MKSKTSVNIGLFIIFLYTEMLQIKKF